MTRTALEKMTVEDFWEVGASGRRYSSEFVFGVLEQRRTAPQSNTWEITDLHCRKLAGEVYLLTCTLLQDNVRLTRRATIWQKTPEGWKILYHQSLSPLHQPWASLTHQQQNEHHFSANGERSRDKLSHERGSPHHRTRGQIFNPLILSRLFHIFRADNYLGLVHNHYRSILHQCSKLVFTGQGPTQPSRRSMQLSALVSIKGW